MNVFMSQLKMMPWVYDDLIVDCDGEALKISQLIERYRELKAAVADVEKMTKKTTTATSKTKTSAKTKTEK